MAERRMFAKSLVESDGFLDLGAASQALYFHLALQADDEGFLNAPRRVLRMLGAGEEDLTPLVECGLVLRFDSGILAIRHWLVHNQIRADRRKGTVCRAERELVEVDEMGCYAMRSAAIPEACEPGTEEISQDRGCEDPSTALRSAQDDRDGGAVDAGAAGKSNSLPQSAALTAAGPICPQSGHFPRGRGNQPSSEGAKGGRSMIAPAGDDEGAADCQTVDNQVAGGCPHRVGKDRDRIDKVNIGKDRMFAAPQSATASGTALPAATAMPAATDQKEISEIFDSYNRICVGLLSCKRLTPERQMRITQALEKWTKEEILALFEKASGIKFFRGQNDRKWKAGFDWLMKAEHLDLLEAGEYDDWSWDNKEEMPTGGTGLGDAELEAVREMMGME